MTDGMGSSEARAASYRSAGLWTDDRIGDLVGRRAEGHPDRELFSFEGRRVTYGEFDRWVAVVGADLVARGVQRGDRVLVQLPNCLEALVLQAAAFRIGAVDVPVVPIYRAHELRQILADARPAAVAAAVALGSRAPAAEVDGLCAELGLEPRVRYVVGDGPTGWVPVPRAGGATTRSLPEPLAADEPAVQLYTSGTTSAPKGVLLTSRALFAHLRNFRDVLGVGADCVVVAGSPLSHLGGFIAGLVFPAFLGSRSVIMRSWDPDRAVELIEEEGGGLMMGATVFITDLVDRYEAGAARRHRLSIYACAGATIPSTLVERAHRAGVRALRCYGMTETAGVCAGASADDPLERRANWDGRVLAGMEIEAVDEDRQVLAPGTVGDLRIRGPQLLTAYTDAEVTAAQIDDDGWFYPGDLGLVDEAGWVKMAGRSKDIINRGGEKFSTLDIEATIAGHPDVAGVAVTAIPDDRLGEGVGAWLVLRPGVAWSGPGDLLAFLDEAQLAKQKLPTEWHVVASLPVSASGKVQKQRLADLTDI